MHDRSLNLFVVIEVLERGQTQKAHDRTCCNTLCSKSSAWKHTENVERNNRFYSKTNFKLNILIAKWTVIKLHPAIILLDGGSCLKVMKADVRFVDICQVGKDNLYENASYLGTSGK